MHPLRPDGALTIMVINKTTSGLTSTLNLSNFNGGLAQVYTYSATNLSQIVRGADVVVTTGAINTTYVAQSITGVPLVAAYLFVTVAALSVYLIFQTAWYFDIKLEGEIASMRGLVRSDALREVKASRESAPDPVVVFPGTQMSRSGNEGRTVGPRTVSGAKRHDPSSVVRDLTS